MNLILSFYNDILNKKRYYLPLAFFSLVGYCFSICNRTVGWDDLIREHYFGDIALAGRWGMAAWIKLLGLQELDPFADHFLALVCLIGASVLISMLLYSISSLKSVFPYTIASSLFVSYPLINEIWEYCAANLFLAGGLLLTTATLVVLRITSNRLKAILLSSFLLVLPISSYEASIFYYLSLVCMVFFLDNLYQGKSNDIRSFLKEWVYYLSPVVIAFVIRIIVSFILRGIYDLESVGGGATDINWLTDAPGLVLYKIAGGNFLKYVLSALVYFPIFEFLMAFIVYLIVLPFVSNKLKKWTVLLYGTLFALSLFSQSILQGAPLPYRTAQTISLFIAFMGFMIAGYALQSNYKVIKGIIGVFLIGVCWYQSVYLNRLLCLDNLRADNESFIIRNVGERIVRDYDRKPVVFISPYSVGPWIKKQITIGDNTWNERLYNTIVDRIIPDSYKKYLRDKYIETNVDCTTEQYAALQNLFAYYGYDIDVVGPIELPFTPEYLHKDTRLLNEAQTIAKRRNMHPYEIYDNGEYLIVALSNQIYFDFDE